MYIGLIIKGTIPIVPPFSLWKLVTMRFVEDFVALQNCKTFGDEHDELSWWGEAILVLENILEYTGSKLYAVNHTLFRIKLCSHLSVRCFDAQLPSLNSCTRWLKVKKKIIITSKSSALKFQGRPDVLVENSRKTSAYPCRKAIRKKDGLVVSLKISGIEPWSLKPHP